MRVGGLDQIGDGRGEQPFDGDAVPHDPGPTAAADIGTENPLGAFGGFRKTPSGTAIERSHAMIPRSGEVGRRIVSARISPSWRGDRSGQRGLWTVTHAQPRNRRTLLA